MTFWVSSYDNFAENFEPIEDVLSADDIIWPETYAISSVYPNPFNPTANFKVEIPHHSYVTIYIYNIN